MIIAVLSLFFYIIDPLLGLIMAIVLPSVLALDTTSTYGEILVIGLLGVAVYFVRKSAYEGE